MFTSQKYYNTRFVGCRPPPSPFPIACGLFALTSIVWASLQEIRGNIRVHCRLRPLISRLDSPGDEDSLGREGTPSERVVDLLDEEKLMVRPTKPVGGQMQRKEFEFERVYSPDTDQQSLFDDVAPLLTSLLDG